MATYKYSKSVQAKLKRLEKLARETAKLSIEVFEDIILEHAGSGSGSPKPKRAAVAMHSIPVPPKPKIEALGDLAYGAGTIEDAAGVLAN
jgi:hypothetical protein